MMNLHGIQAQAWWRDQMPVRYTQIEDPETFFRDLGEQAEAEIENLYLQYAYPGPDDPRETAEEKQARLVQAMDRAKEEVYAELVTPDPGSQGEPDPETSSSVIGQE